MALSNKERVGKILDGLLPEMKKFVEQELRNKYGDQWGRHVTPGDGNLDVQRLCRTILDQWDFVFEAVLSRDLKDTIHNIRKWRGHYAHQNPFTLDETLSALIAFQRFLEAIQSPLAEEVERSKLEVMRTQFESGAKREQKKVAQQAVLGIEIAGLKPWREVVVPHEDVAKGQFQQAEFAADLWQVYQGGGTDEYRDPRAFYGRTYLTEGLRELLANAMRRLRGEGGDPVVELKINFGGGKTHSMLALYHLFGGQAKAFELAGMEEVLKAVGVQDAPTVRRAVVVGTALRPGSPIDHDGTVVRTLWGELAWQLAGREGYEIVRRSDETATNPGDLMDEVFALAGPSLVLIDEWVAYARQLVDRQNMLPAGDFDTQFTFAQTLCEAARRAKNVLVCVSIPASERDGIVVSTAQAGDEAGRRALERLQDAVGRSNMVWRPASSDESFEIVRRRLFQPVAGDQIASRDATIKEFAALYRAHPNDFPSECHRGDYERRMQSAYPIHPELFDRLYSDWSTLEKFQRTRGVLRLMASVIHSLWSSNDAGALILPASVPMADPAVQSEVTRYLPESWTAVIDRDVDGFGSVPMQLDAENASRYGRYSACRRVARTVFLGSAPLKDAAGRGVDERRVKLGSVQPKETIAEFSDALGKLRGRTTYLYADGSRFWYHTQASVNREAQERAERKTREEAHQEIVRRLRESFKGSRRGEFDAVHVGVPSSDVPDDRCLRLVALGMESPHKAGKGESDALAAAKEYLASRGSAPRGNKNRLVFLAADATRLEELESAVRQHLAWVSICEDIESRKLNLDMANMDTSKESVRKTAMDVMVKLGEVVSYVIVPSQPDPRGPVAWEAVKVPGNIEQFAERAVKKLLSDEHLTRDLGGVVLRRYVDSVPLWRDDRHVSMVQLQDDFAKYVYLPRLIELKKLNDAVRDGTRILLGDEGFAYADEYDEATGAYTKLRQGLGESLGELKGWLVRLEVASPIIDAESSTPPPDDLSGGVGVRDAGGGRAGYDNFLGSGQQPSGGAATKAAKTRFHGSIILKTADFREKSGDVSREVIQQLARVLGSDVEIVLEVNASVTEGFPEDVVRSVSENCRTLRFGSFEFEDE